MKTCGLNAEYANVRWVGARSLSDRCCCGGVGCSGWAIGDDGCQESLNHLSCSSHEDGVKLGEEKITTSCGFETGASSG